MTDEIIKLGELEINLNELTQFIVTAKKSCYAGNGEEEIMPDGSKKLVFREWPFLYEDNYAGYFQAPGTEIVWHKPDGQRIWQMSYSGGMIADFIRNEKLAKDAFEFLKKALSHEKAFLRGPENFKENSFVYINQFEGDIKRFRGDEDIINSQAIEIFSQDYIGGLVIPKQSILK